MRSRWYRHVPTRAKPKAWYQGKGGVRLAQDQAQISATYPDLMYHIADEDGQVRLEGTITLLAECGVPKLIPVRVEFPLDYPQREPRAYDAADRFPHEANRHFYPDGRCCLWLPPETRWKAEDSEGLCHFLEEIAVFFDRQLIYDAEGKGIWPGEQRSHYTAGYIEYIQELLNGDKHLLDALAPTFANRSGTGRNSPCPCGSGIKYKKCHLHIVEDISQRVGSVELRTIFYKRCSDTTLDKGSSHFLKPEQSL